MPLRTRTRSTKVMKENIDVVKKNKVKTGGKVSKPPRKALADKTNSLSDDNASIDVPIKTSKKVLKSKDEKARPGRDRRLPPRYIENETLKNLSNNKDSPVKLSHVTSKAKTQIKQRAKQDSLLSSQDVQNQSSNKSSVEDIHTIAQAKPKVKGSASQSSKPAKTDKQGPITKYLSSTENGQTTRPRRNCQKQPIIEKSQNSVNHSSPFKSPSNGLESSLILNRPKRIHRLPSRFEDHSISPNKFIPVQPCHASTPLQEKNTKSSNKNTLTTSQNEKIVSEIGKSIEKPVSTGATKSKGLKAVNKVNSSNSSIEKTSPDSNNNGKKHTRPVRATVKAKLTNKQTNATANKVKPFVKRLLDKSLSFQVLGDNKTDEKGDVYEFTFDPNEEPTPQKKKRKRPAQKRPPKPKTVVFKSNYDDNVSKALENLKNRVKPSQTESAQRNVKPQNVKAAENHATPTENQAKTSENHAKTNENLVNPLLNHVEPVQNHVKPIENIPSALKIAESKNNLPQNNYSANITPAIPLNDTANSIHASNYASIRVEDIAADFALSQDDLNYSPVNSPHPQHQEAPETHLDTNLAPNNDPLNLKEGASFFEDTPVASSSMNMSSRQPLASPWRVEFGSLPMKWHNNTYVKPNMTPAVECSFVNSEQSSKKKHVYTNMLPDEPLPEIFDNPAPALKQTSIISFIKEVVEKKNKKKRRRSPSPVQTNSIFEDTIATTTSEVQKTPNKKAKIAKDSTSYTSNDSNNSKDKENSTNSSHKSSSPQKKQKKKDKDCTYFGFDESENLEQENVSPQKQNKNMQSMKTRSLRSRNVLQELNAQPIPTRAVLPVNPKSKLPSSEAVEQLYDQLKSTEDARLPAMENAKEPNVVTDLDGQSIIADDDSQSVHLFEDIEVVHHLKPHRKSYGKAKKVTFIQTENDSDSDSQQPAPVPVDPDQSSDEEDLADLSFHLPDFKQKKPAKKKKNKKLLTKKEEKEVEEWAAGFNSMCEDIDEFPLVFE